MDCSPNILSRLGGLCVRKTLMRQVGPAGIQVPSSQTWSKAGVGGGSGIGESAAALTGWREVAAEPAPAVEGMDRVGQGTALHGWRRTWRASGTNSPLFFLSFKDI